MHIFYIPHINGESVTLTEDESKHCVRVLRLTNGDKISAIDGKGNLIECQILNPNPKRCLVGVVDTKTEFGKRNFYLHIAIAPTKNIDRFEWFLEKATEIGVDEITPLLCEHSERKTVNMDRIERVVISAMKQSIKAYMPKLNDITPFKSVCANSTQATKMIAYCGDYNEMHAKNIILPGQSNIILVGPEGDFSPNEVQIATQYDFTKVGLGNSRLRTETAGVYACTIANMINQV